MGFRQDAYARLWTYDNNKNYGIGNVSISRKNKETKEYETDFQDGFVRFIGDAHKKALELSLPTKDTYDKKNDKGVSIRIKSCDVTNRYDAEKRKLYTNFCVFDFEVVEKGSSPDNKSGSSSAKSAKSAGTSAVKKQTKAAETVDEDDDELPF